VTGHWRASGEAEDSTARQPQNPSMEAEGVAVDSSKVQWLAIRPPKMRNHSHALPPCWAEGQPAHKQRAGTENKSRPLFGSLPSGRQPMILVGKGVLRKTAKSVRQVSARGLPVITRDVTKSRVPSRKVAEEGHKTKGGVLNLLQNSGILCPNESDPRWPAHENLRDTGSDQVCFDPQQQAEQHSYLAREPVTLCP